MSFNDMKRLLGKRASGYLYQVEGFSEDHMFGSPPKSSWVGGAPLRTQVVNGLKAQSNGGAAGAAAERDAVLLLGARRLPPRAQRVQWRRRRGGLSSHASLSASNCHVWIRVTLSVHWRAAWTSSSGGRWLLAA